MSDEAIDFYPLHERPLVVRELGSTSDTTRLIARVEDPVGGQVYSTLSYINDRTGQILAVKPMTDQDWIVLAEMCDTMAAVMQDAPSRKRLVSSVRNLGRRQR